MSTSNSPNLELDGGLVLERDCLCQEGGFTRLRTGEIRHIWQRTTDRTLPVVIELILDEAQNQTGSVANSATRRSRPEAVMEYKYLDFPTADSPEYGDCKCRTQQ